MAEGGHWARVISRCLEDSNSPFAARGALHHIRLPNDIDLDFQFAHLYPCFYAHTWFRYVSIEPEYIRHVPRGFFQIYFKTCTDSDTPDDLFAALAVVRRYAQFWAATRPEGPGLASWLNAELTCVKQVAAILVSSSLFMCKHAILQHPTIRRLIYFLSQSSN